MGRVFLKTLGCTVLASTAAVAIGVGLVVLFTPGVGANLAATGSPEKIIESAAAAKPLTEALLDLLPKNPVASATRALEGEIIGLMVACLIIGAAMSAAGVREKVAHTLVPFLEQVFAVCMTVVGFAMLLAPAGDCAPTFAASPSPGCSARCGSTPSPARR